MFFMSFLQLMSQYPSLYSTPTHSESGKWDALVKASESLLKEKELIIERQVFLVILLGERIFISYNNEIHLDMILQCCIFTPLVNLYIKNFLSHKFFSS